MQKVHVNLSRNSYSIVIGEKNLAKLGSMLKRFSLGDDAIVITNKCIRSLHGKKLISGLKLSGFSVKVLEVADSERSKSADSAIRLLGKIVRHDVKKKIFIIAFGGGVIGDLAGFVAAIYKRGVPYVQVPTTFLAQIDSAIGGKTAIDLSTGKNLVGAFYQPRLVFSDVSLLKTLSKRQIKNGLAEAVKYGVISDKKLFFYIKDNYKRILNVDTYALKKVVVSCSKIKAKVVELDEKETKGIRTILNFGHTVGHAIEAAGGYNSYHHGESVALGMRIAGSISFSLGLCGEKSYLLLNEVLSNIGLPDHARKLRTASILKIMEHDKKFKNKKNRFVLMNTIGKVSVLEGISKAIIKKSIKSYLK